MIKYQNIICGLLIGVLAVSFSFSQERASAVDIRAQGMGQAMLTDSESFYTLFNNPASLVFAGKKVLLPTFGTSSIGGDFAPIAKIGPKFITGFGENAEEKLMQELTSSLTGLLSDNGLAYSSDISAPLTFGKINNNFGWGLLNTINIDLRIPSLTKSDICAGMDFDLYFGYAIPMNLGALGTISAGATLRGISGVDTGTTQGLSTLIGSISGSDSGIDFSSMPVNLKVGVGLDIGVQYDLLNFISIAAVLKDCYSPIWIKSLYPFGDGAELGTDFEYFVLPRQLAVGVGVDIPVEKFTAGVLSHLGVHLDYQNFLQLAESVHRNPVLELALGAEAVLFKTFAFRLGVHEMYPSAGLGIYLGKFRIDYSIFGKELGLEPGSFPQLNMGLSLSVQYYTLY